MDLAPPMRTVREMLARDILNAAPPEKYQSRACVAIDIGSRYSGFAYAIVERRRRGDEEESGLRCWYGNKSPGSSSTLPSTPTAAPPTPIGSRSPDAHEVHAVCMMMKPLDSRYPRHRPSISSHAKSVLLTRNLLSTSSKLA